jgi:linoleoyl-CoA desaturase
MRQGTIKFVNRDKSTFFTVLRDRIDGYFAEKSQAKHGDYRLIIKALIMLSVLLVPYILILTNVFSPGAMLGFALLMGLGTAGVGMSVMHDANHGSLSGNNNINNWFSGCLYLLGGNVLNWRVQHNTLHHTYTNIHDMDEDITGKPLIRLSHGDPLHAYHRFQHIYAWPLYGLMTISFFVKDFRMALKYSKIKDSKILKPFTRNELITLVISKIGYAIFALLPLFVTSLTFGQWLIGFLVIHITAGLILTTVFQLAHVVEGADQPEPETNGVVGSAWAIHQLQTTANFGCPRWLSWYIGGLDYQVEHHLFPSISHIHYPALAKIVRQTATEFGIPYNQKPSFGAALVSHVKALQALGR